ncbi:MAG: (2Fe-2S)-binding protein, partial [Oscillospiraceae bacterium]|nr:(2Fe-2S)-binding protein [Oscillospiraceae bacterium]
MNQITITIDGKKCTGPKGDTILNIARLNGIEILSLCYNGLVKTYGACGVCVVESESSPKLLRSCST